MVEQLNTFPHCNENSIRETRVTTVAPGWEIDPPSGLLSSRQVADRLEVHIKTVQR